jgi:hypothetical protein
LNVSDADVDVRGDKTGPELNRAPVILDRFAQVSRAVALAGAVEEVRRVLRFSLLLLPAAENGNRRNEEREQKRENKWEQKREANACRVCH